MVTLNSNQKIVRNQWFKYVFFPAINDTPTPYFKKNPSLFASVKENAIQIRDVFLNGKLTYNNEQLDNLASIGVVDQNGNLIMTVSSLVLAEYIASFCQDYNLTIDDYYNTKYTLREKNLFRMSKLGRSLSSFGVLLSEKIANDAAKVKAQAQNAPAQPQSAAGQNSAQASNNGPRPKKAQSLGLTNGGQKISIVPAGAPLLWIGGEFIASKNTKPRVFTKPSSKFCRNGRPQMFVNGTGQGYDDCVLFFSTTDATAVQDIAKKLNDPASGYGGPKVKRYEVKQVHSSGEYYEIEVEKPWGGTVIAYIKAERLQEMLDRELKENAAKVNELLRDLEF